MADVYFACCSEDAEFARRIALDLQARGVTSHLHEWSDEAGSLLRSLESGLTRYGYFVPVISTASLGPDWSMPVLNRALHSVLTEYGAEVLPIKKDTTELPAALRDKPTADFSSSYDDGLSAMWQRLTEIRTGLLGRLPPFELWCGWRGAEFVEGARRQSTVVAAQTEQMIGVVMVNSVGQAALAAELTAVIADTAQSFLQESGQTCFDATISCIAEANRMARQFCSEFGVQETEQLGAAMAVVCWSETEGWLATVGLASGLIRNQVGEDYRVHRFQSAVSGGSDLEKREDAERILPAGRTHETGVEDSENTVFSRPAGGFSRSRQLATGCHHAANGGIRWNAGAHEYARTGDPVSCAAEPASR
jgi:hypothetical protein